MNNLPLPPVLIDNHIVTNGINAYIDFSSGEWVINLGKVYNYDDLYTYLNDPINTIIHSIVLPYDCEIR